MKRRIAFVIALITVVLAIFISCDDKPVFCKITFDSAGGTEVSALWVESGSTVAKPTPPIRDGYTFEGWYLGETKWDFALGTVTSDITLVAKWTQDPPQSPPQEDGPENGGGEEGDQTTVDRFAAIDKTGCPETLLLLDDYFALEENERKTYIEAFDTEEDILRWYQEAYRLSGRKGAISSKNGYMDKFDNKTGFPQTVLTWEEYKCVNWRIQNPYLKTFATTADFLRWSQKAQDIYEEEQNREVIGDNDTEIDMGS